MQNIERVNQNDGNCIVCFKPLVETIERFGQKADVSVGVKHHISYFPEKVAWVHQKCHNKIHDPENPITYLIQYEEGDSEKFYKIQHAKK